MEDNTNIMSGDLNALKQFRDMVSSYNEAVQNSAGCASDEKRLEISGQHLRKTDCRGSVEADFILPCIIPRAQRKYSSVP